MKEVSDMDKKNEMELLILENNKLKEDYKYLHNLYQSEIVGLNFRLFFKRKIKAMLTEGIFNFFKRKIKNLINLIVRKLKNLLRPVKRLLEHILYYNQLRRIISKNKGKKIIVFYPGYDFNMAMYQRPQHIASQFAKKNYLYFYCTLNINDNGRGFLEIEDGLYITNLFHILKKMNRKFIKEESV